MRYEKYGDKGDFYAISGFYKSFKDPIELSFIRSATGQFTPLNLGDANVYGGEIEVRKHLGFIPGWENFGINFNFSIIESQQKFSEDERENREENQDSQNLQLKEKKMIKFKYYLESLREKLLEHLYLL